MPIPSAQLQRIKREHVDELSRRLAAGDCPEGTLFLPFPPLSGDGPDRLALSPIAAQVSIDRFLRTLWSELRCQLEDGLGLKVPRLAVDGIVSPERRLEAVILGDGLTGHVIASLGSLQFLWAMNRWSVLSDRDPPLTMPPTQERKMLHERIYRKLIELGYWFYSGTAIQLRWDYWRASDEELPEVDFITRIQVAFVLLHEVAHMALGHSGEVWRGWDEKLAKEYPLLGAVGHNVDLEYKADLYGLELLLSYVKGTSVLIWRESYLKVFKTSVLPRARSCCWNGGPRRSKSWYAAVRKRTKNTRLGGCNWIVASQVGWLGTHGLTLRLTLRKTNYSSRRPGTYATLR